MSISKINIKNLFPGISKVCKNCNTCCKTYGWLLEEEAKKFIKKDYPVINLNNSIFCIDSFRRDKKRNFREYRASGKPHRAAFSNRRKAACRRQNLRPCNKFFP